MTSKREKLTLWREFAKAFKDMGQYLIEEKSSDYDSQIEVALDALVILYEMYTGHNIDSIKINCSCDKPARKKRKSKKPRK